MSVPIRFYSVAWICLLTLFTGCGVDTGDPSSKGSPYEIRETTTMGGTGRFYMGREIADVMQSEHGAVWLDRTERDTEELPSRLLRVLELNQANVVADIGAGTGFLTFRLASMVPSGRVLAVEVQPAMLDTIRVRMERENVRNIQPLLGTAQDPALPEESVDLALIVSSYHEFSHPAEMLSNIYRGLREGGRIVIVEYRGEDDTITADDVHRMSEEQIRLELEGAGFRWRDTIDVLPQQHVVIFERPVTTRVN